MSKYLEIILDVYKPPFNSLSAYNCQLKNISHICITRWYPYVLITSSLFLLLTVGIYSYYDKLLNYITRIMRHFAISLFISFILLSLNLMHFAVEPVDDIGRTLCKISGEINIDLKYNQGIRSYLYVTGNCKVVFELCLILFADRCLDTIFLLGRVHLHDCNELGNLEPNYVSSTTYKRG